MRHSSSINKESWNLKNRNIFQFIWEKLPVRKIILNSWKSIESKNLLSLKEYVKTQRNLKINSAELSVSYLMGNHLKDPQEKHKNPGDIMSWNLMVNMTHTDACIIYMSTPIVERFIEREYYKRFLPEHHHRDSRQQNLHHNQWLLILCTDAIEPV